MGKLVERHYGDRVGREAQMSSGTMTTTLLNWRVTAEQRGTVQAAARAMGMTMSALMREAAMTYSVRAMGTR